MTKWLSRLFRVVLMGLAWAAAWVPVGVVVGWFIVGEMEPEWIGGPLYAGFLCGVMFSAVAGIASGRRRLDEMSPVTAGALGAMAGLFAGALWVFIVLASDPAKWLLNGTVVGSLTLLSAVSGAGSAFLARVGKHDTRTHAA